MEKHLILLDSNTNPLLDIDIPEEVNTFGDLKLHLNRLNDEDRKPLNWWNNLEVFDANHNSYERGDNNLEFEEYDGIEKCLVLYTKQKAKRQESGANTERSQILNKIKELNLGKVVKERFGKNQTQVASPLLVALIKETEEGTVSADNSRTATTVETVEIVETTPTESKPALTAANPEEAPTIETPKEEEQEYDEIRILIPKALQSKVKIVTSPNPKRDWAKLKDLNPFK